MTRAARVERLTRETQIMVELDLDGVGVVEVGTGVPFFDHMLAQLGKHGSLDLTVRAKGDVEIDAHHTVEDTAIALGQALRQALGDKSGIARFGHAMVPLDETLVQAAVDLSGRPYVVHREPDGMAPLIGTYDTTLTRHVFESLAFSAGICLHVRVIEGRNPHHIVEAQFKAVARALRAAAAPDPRPAASPARRGARMNTPASQRASQAARRRAGPEIVVLDYGSGNLRSAQRALERAGAQVEVTADPDAVLDCDGLAVPGVGAFAACMAGLRGAGGDKLIARRLELGRPVLGICVGMQVLFAAGRGARGTVRRLRGLAGDGGAARRGRAAAHGLEHGRRRRPARRCSPGIDPGTRFYFVHSYALRAPAPSGSPRPARWSPGPSTASRSPPQSSRARWPRPSSTRRSPATPAPPCWPTGWRHL